MKSSAGKSASAKTVIEQFESLSGEEQSAFYAERRTELLREELRLRGGQPISDPEKLVPESDPKKLLAQFESMAGAERSRFYDDNRNAILRATNTQNRK